MTISGTVAFRIEASARSVDCSPQVIRKNGTTMLMIDITSRWPYCRGLRGSGSRRQPDDRGEDEEPENGHNATRVSGGRPSSTPILMKT